MLKERAEEIYSLLKLKPTTYNEAKHCTMILRVMGDKDKGRYSAFCTEAFVSERTFYTWLKENELFFECYTLGRMFARERWEEEGEEIAQEMSVMGSSNHRFEHWRMIGWSRWGVGKNARIRLDLDPKATPDKHYSQLLAQAAQGDFTAGEIKQLMEAINVGLNTHQVFKLQQEIDALRADLATMAENANGDNFSANKRITKKD
jgi:hypothetical protein